MSFGVLVKVDLGAGSWSAEEVSKETVRSYLGGRGIGLWLLHSMGAPTWRPSALDPEAPLIVASGPLAGTGVPMSSRAAAVFMSPLNGRWNYSTVGGSLAPVMRYADVDILLIVGRAPRPSYLVIEGRRVEVRDAGDLWGLGTYEAERRLREVHGQDSAVMVIGPAGESLVPFASINHETWRQFGRAGGGAVMGSKNLKAIVFVPGSRYVEASDPERLWDLVSQMTEKLRIVATGYRERGTLGTIDAANGTGFFPSLYWSSVSLPGWERISWHSSIRASYLVPHRATCLHCPVACHKLVTSRLWGGLYELEYESTFALAGLTGVADPDALVRLASLADDLGLDTITLGNVLGLAAYLAEKGVLPDAPRFGDWKGMESLIADIAYRRGRLGQLLSRGTAAAARELGVEGLAIHVKGLEPAGYDPRSLKGMILTYAVAERGADHLWSSGYAVDIPGQAGGRQATGPEKVRAVMDLEERNAIYDSALLCKFGRGAYGWDELVDVINAATGLGHTKESLRQVAQRIIVLHRWLNGTTIDDDRLPPRWLKEPVEFEGSRMVVTEEEWASMISLYYRLRGYDEKGVPKRETLEALGIL